jgi:vitamin B12 transporter
MNIFYKIFFIAFLFLNIPIASTQNLDSVQLGELIIKENRLQTAFQDMSRDVVIISASDIKASTARTLPELLSYTAGVDIRQRGIGGIQADINLRGSTFDQILILINGASVADPQTGHHLLNIPITLENIDRIEILKGSGARSYGQNAFAGVINIITKSPKDKFQGGVRIKYGTAQTGQIGANINVPIGKTATMVSYDKQKSSGYRENADYSLQNMLLQNKLNLGKITINTMIGNSNRKFGASGYYAGPASNGYAALPIDNTTDEYETVSTTFGSVSTEIPYKSLKIRPRLTYRNNDDTYYFIRNTSVFNSTASSILTGDINISSENKLGISGLGISIQNTDFKSLRLDTVQRQVYSVSLEHRFNFFDKNLDITPGVFMSNFSDFGSSVHPGIDVGVKLNKQLKFYSTLASTLRIPTYTDLYFQNGGNLNNPNLKPEKAINYEAGLRLNTNKISGAVSYFIRKGSEIIDRVKKSTTEPKWWPTNLNNLNISGAEIHLAYTPKSSNNTKIDGINFSSTYIPTVNYKKDLVYPLSRYASDLLRYQANLGVNATLLHHVGQSVNLRYFERYVLPKSYESNYSGWLLDYKASYKIKQGEFSLQVNNLTNKKYTESNGITMPGRWVMVGVTVTDL